MITHAELVQVNKYETLSYDKKETVVGNVTTISIHFTYVDRNLGHATKRAHKIYCVTDKVYYDNIYEVIKHINKTQHTNITSPNGLYGAINRGYNFKGKLYQLVYDI